MLLKRAGIKVMRSDSYDVDDDILPLARKAFATGHATLDDVTRWYNLTPAEATVLSGEQANEEQ